MKLTKKTADTTWKNFHKSKKKEKKKMKTYRKTFALVSFIINRPYVQRL